MSGSAPDAAPEALASRLTSVRERVVDAARACGRDPADVTLIAVSKTVPVEIVSVALALGQRDLGENRAQELVAKARVLDAAGRDSALAPVWHFVGRLQRNKVRALAAHVACWHSVDRPELAPVLAEFATGARVLVQVNLAAERQKGGCDPAAVPALVDELRAHGLDVAGLMTVPPAAEEPRPYFARLRELAARLGLPHLSMGMTGDFETAIAEGATMVRIGSAVFGGRHAVEGRRR